MGVFAAVVLATTAAMGAPPGFVSVRGDQFVCNGRICKLKGTNYYPRDHMWAAMWDDWDLKTITRDAGMLRQAGLNCVRILVPYSKGGWKGAGPPADRLNMLTSLINLLGAKGIRSCVTLFDWETTYPEAGSKTEAHHLKYVHAIVARLRDNPYVLLWDVKNEPDHPRAIDGKDDWDACPDKRVKITSWLVRMCDGVRALDKNHPVGVGIRWYTNADDVMDAVDVAMFHSYWPTIGTQQIPFVKKACGRKPKPILVEEFGWPTNPTPCDRDGKMLTNYTEKDQEDFYAQHLAAFKEHDVAGCIQWMTFDAAKYGNDPKESFEKYFGLWRYDLTLKPAGALYRDQMKVAPFPVERTNRAELR